MDNLFEIVVILVLIVLNGLFSMSETAMVSARKARLQQRAENGDTRARIALELATHPDRFLSTVQVGITLIGILAGAFGGANLSEGLAAALERGGLSRGVSQNAAFALVVAAITYLSLVIGELVPKRLALSHAESIATRVAGPMRTLSVIASPIVTMLSVSNNVVLRVLGIRPSDDPPITEDEINILIAQGTAAGVFEETEREIVERVFRLGDRRVVNFMTPRTDVVWLDIEASEEENRRRLSTSGHHLFPVCRGSLDEVLGVVTIRDLWGARTIDAAALQAAAVKPLIVLESLRPWKLLEQFKQTSLNIAVVVDEYGGVSGLVTANDLMDAMVGEIPVAGGDGDQVVRREDGSWLLDGMLTLDDLSELLDTEVVLPDEATGYYTTLGGFMMAHLGRVPAISDHFAWNGYRFEVVDMDGNRVDRVLVIPLAVGDPSTKHEE